MIKITLLIFLLSSAQCIAATEDTSIPALQAIEQFGGITITDGSSFFTFSKDGSFQSGPLGMSGRAFKGRWISSGLTFKVTAKLGWINGLSTDQEYRRIDFVIYHVQKRQPKEKPFNGKQPELFDSYFFIDELVKIPKPAEVNSK